MDIDKFKQLPILGILRGIDKNAIEPIVEAVIASGLKTIEITMNTVGAPELIRLMVNKANGRLTVGAGTVLSMDDLLIALKAGASFIVMPVLIGNIVEYCVKHSIPIFPGALTPQEIYRAWDAGASMVKIFPANVFGPEYFKEIHGPFNNIELLACGGVNSENICTFFSCGASAVAFGGSIFKKSWIKDHDFLSIKEAIEKLITAYRLYQTL